MKKLSPPRRNAERRVPRPAFALALLLALVPLSLSVGCGDTKNVAPAIGDDMDGANKLVEEGNAAVSEANTHADEGAAKSLEAFDFEERTRTSSDWGGQAPAARQASESLGKAIEGFTKAAGKFAEAGALDVDDYFKQYLDTKARGFRTRADQLSADREKLNALLDASIRDAKTLVERVNDADARSQKLTREAEALEAQAEKIRREHADKFEPEKKDGAEK